MVVVFNGTTTYEIYTLSLHDALPIYGGIPGPRSRPPWRSATRSMRCSRGQRGNGASPDRSLSGPSSPWCWNSTRSEEHTSELQSRQYLVCRLLLEKKKKKKNSLLTLK